MRWWGWGGRYQNDGTNDGRASDRYMTATAAAMMAEDGYGYCGYYGYYGLTNDSYMTATAATMMSEDGYGYCGYYSYYGLANDRYMTAMMRPATIATVATMSLAQPMTAI